MPPEEFFSQLREVDIFRLNRPNIFWLIRYCFLIGGKLLPLLIFPVMRILNDIRVNMDKTPLSTEKGGFNNLSMASPLQNGFRLIVNLLTMP